MNNIPGITGADIEAPKRGPRSRYHRKPTGKVRTLTPRLQLFLKDMRQYNPVPTRLAYALYVRHGQGKNYHNFLAVLRDCYHEDFGGGPLLERPDELNPDHGHRLQAWHTLSPIGEALSCENEDEPIIRFMHRDPLHHRGFGACVGASFEALAPRFGMDHIHQEEALRHRRTPESTRRSRNPLMVELRSGRKYEPDALTGFRKATERGKALNFYLREQDKCTESFYRADKLQESIRLKIDNITELFETRAYERQWGLPALAGVMFVTTAPGRLHKIIEYLQGNPYADKFLFKVFPDFHKGRWKAPKEPMSVFEPWIGVNGPRDITIL